LLPPLVETGRRGLRPRAGGGPDPDAVGHYVALVLKHTQEYGNLDMRYPIRYNRHDRRIEKESKVSILSGWVGTVLGFVIGLMPLVIVHELGHFTVARLIGVWAREFGIGFPPRIVKLFKWKETEFTLNWLPLGGFVRLEGEDAYSEVRPPDEDMTAEETAEAVEARAHSLSLRPPLQRVAVMLGGPVMNLLAAWVIAVLVFMTGIPATRVAIDGTAAGSPAEAAGMQSGDVIVAIDGTEIETLEDVSAAVDSKLEQPVVITLEREGAALDVTLTPRSAPPEGEGAMGVSIVAVEAPGELQRYSLGESLKYGTNYMGRAMGVTLMLPFYIVRMRIPLAEARPVGVIGISQLAQGSMESSVSVGSAYPFLQVVLLLSLSLGIFNLLPIPALDGGRIVFALIEKVRGKKLPARVEERIHQVTYAILLVIFVVITVLDVVSPVPMP